MYAYLDILILLAVVFAVFYRLRSILGTNSPERKIIVIADEKKKAEVEKFIKQQVRQLEQMPRGESELDIVLAKIPNFNRDSFLNSAKKAFEIIVCAFAAGDFETLRELTSKKIYDSFESIILKRQTEGQIAETDFIGIDKAQIVDAKIVRNVAKIVVNFVSEQVNIIKDAKGEIVQGDENFVQKINDVWTFEKNLNKNSNIWLLSSTKK